MANTTKIVHFQTSACNTKRNVVMVAMLRSGAGTHKSGPRGGQRNVVRDILDEYYAEEQQSDIDPHSQPS
jgi:hypothetical protein